MREARGFGKGTRNQKRKEEKASAKKREPREPRKNRRNRLRVRVKQGEKQREAFG